MKIMRVVVYVRIGPSVCDKCKEAVKKGKKFCDEHEKLNNKFKELYEKTRVDRN